MASYEYKCIPGPSQLIVKSQADSATAVRSYADLINSEADDGWEFHSLESMTVAQAAGCGGGGDKTPPVIFNMLIFKRSKK